MKSGPAQVLEALRRAEGRSCSGQVLSNRQGVSRAQVWKYVEALRRRGYAIEAEAGGGYRLVAAPDRLFPEEIHARLGTRWLARDVHHLDSTDSTNRVALELARDGAAHGTTVIAEGQTAGRGRLGRAFFSPPYSNLYTSIVLRPRLSTSQAPTWTLGAATAVAETLTGFVSDPSCIEIKWPNDVLLGGYKTCGILMELGAEATRVAFLVLGIGVNLNVDRESFPEEFRARATSLSSHEGREIDRVEFACSLFENLERTFDHCADGGFATIRPRFESRFRMAGQRVRVLDLDGSEQFGRVCGIDADGALRLEKSPGDEFRVIAGEVTLAAEAP